MTKITLEKFIEKTKGAKIDVPWKSNGHLKGQCVSLIQQYILQCLEQPAKARGNAKDWQTSYVKEGLGTITKIPRKGDIIVFPKLGSLGHIAIYIDKNTIYDQNNSSHDNKCAGYGKMLSSNCVILRPNAKLLSEVKEEFIKGDVYITLEDMNIRNGAGLNFAIKKVKDITADGKKNVTSNNLNNNAVYKKGIKFTLQEVIKNKDNSVWGKTPSGYVCLKGSTGKVFIKKG